MKNISPALLNFLQTTDNFNTAELFLIQLINGQVIAATTAQMPITFSYAVGSPTVSTTNTYYPSTFGAWERGKVKLNVNYVPKGETMDLAVVADTSVILTIGGATIPMMTAIAAGLFDAAQVTVYKIYWAIGSTPAAGIAAYGGMVTFLGKILNVSPAGRSKVKFSVADMLYLLNFDTPPNLIQTGCRFQLFDHGCTLIRTNFSFSSTVHAGGSPTIVVFTPDDVTSASWWNSVMTLTQGTLLFTSGLNAGLYYYIKQMLSTNVTFPHLPTAVQLSRPLMLPAAIGDTYNLFPGCAKDMAACTQQYNNLIHFGGMPFVPNPEQAA